MAVVRGEEEVDKIIQELLTKSKSNHITQSVTFKKDSPRQMELLKFALMNSESFSALMKEFLAREYDGISIMQMNSKQPKAKEIPKIEKMDTGNFL